MSFAHSAYYNMAYYRIWKYLVSATRGKHLVIRRHRPFHWFVLWSLVCISFGVVIYFICLSEFDALVGNRFSTNINEEQLQNLSARLTSQNNRLRDRVAMLESATRIDHVAYREINKTVESLQDDIRDAKEELAFYRGLVTSSDQGKGLTIQSFTLRPGDADHTYHYRIVLTRFQKDAKVAKGTVELSVIGKQEEGPIRLGLSDMMIEGPDRLVFQFKNFQKFEGYLILPTGFIPYQVVMTIDLKKKKAQRITKTVDWPSILEGV